MQNFTDFFLNKAEIKSGINFTFTNIDLDYFY